MLNSEHPGSRLLLPPRAQIAAGTSQFSVRSRLDLAARIAELEWIEIVDVPSDTVPAAVEIFLQNPAVPLRKRQTPKLICRIDRTGIEIHGLSDRDRHHILSRRWGRLIFDAVQLYLPRDDNELETCWSVVKHAYDSTIEAESASSAARLPELPKYSRTSLQ